MTDSDEPTTASESPDTLDTELPMTQHDDPTADPTAEPGRSRPGRRHTECASVSHTAAHHPVLAL